MKIPQRQEIWENDYSQAYIIGVNGYGFVQYIKKTGEVYQPLEFDQESFMKTFKFKCNSPIDVADLFKTENEE